MRGAQAHNGLHFSNDIIQHRFFACHTSLLSTLLPQTGRNIRWHHGMIKHPLDTLYSTSRHDCTPIDNLDLFSVRI